MNGAGDIAAEHLRIELDTKKGRKPPATEEDRAKYAKDWKRACGQLSKALTAEKGPWGFGAFGSFACYRAKNRVSGQDKATKWTLTVVDGLKEVAFTLYRGTEVQSTVTMPPSQYTMQFFQDDEFTDLISYALDRKSTRLNSSH